MTGKQNILPIENKKPVETVCELKEEYKVPSFEEFMETYESEERVVDNYELEVDSYGDIRVNKSCGPGSGPSCLLDDFTLNAGRVFSIRLSFNSDNGFVSGSYGLFFERYNGEHTDTWQINGNISQLRSELRKLENGEIRVVRNKGGYYQRAIKKEGEIKRDLRKWIEEKERGISGNAEIEYSDWDY